MIYGVMLGMAANERRRNYLTAIALLASSARTWNPRVPLGLETGILGM